MTINHDFYADHKIFIENIEKFCAREIKPFLKKWEAEKNFPNALFKLLGDQGFLGIFVPENFGGINGDYILAGAWCETFGRLRAVGLTTAVNMHSLVVSKAISERGSPQAKDFFLSQATNGKMIGAYAFTEPDAGSDLANIKTTAQAKGKKWVINGSKTFITNGARADFVLTFAKTDSQAGRGGFTTFIVPTKSAGFSVTRKLDKLGWHSSDTAELSYQNVEVEEWMVLGKVGEGWEQATQNLTWERLMLALTSLAGAKICLKETIDYCKQRSVFGKKLIQIPVIAEILREANSKLVRGTAMARAALLALNNGQDASLGVAVCKRTICEDAIWIANQAIQFHGGYGYTTEFAAEQWWRDLRLMTIGGGASEIMSNIISKKLRLCS
ncbi:MAG TPA: acyl-CoA dehydrogenase family protein [Oligoflexia bacterium]|nr:acyl-CoA dehydrogenase family protein [Oligoflexia bacterium]HMP27138.1 acyl-CoA dehydrogenase family protein [Oligoflexia bacterium]